MSNLRTVFMGCLAATLAACSGSDFQERFVTACSTASDMPDEVCECLASLAEEDLSADARTLLVAMLEDDEEAVAEMRGSIPVAEAMQAGMFMTEAGRCASEMDPSDPSPGG